MTVTKTEEAILFATLAHAGTRRKGKDRPYILHPLEVMTIVAELTDDEDVIAAAVLHDTVEDTFVTPEGLKAKFGERVAKLVAAESENKREGLPAESTWEIRKQETIDHLKQADRDVLMICLGDKLANIREMARDYSATGDALWLRFNQKDKKKLGWYYRSIFEILAEKFGEIRQIREYGELLKQLF